MKTISQLCCALAAAVVLSVTAEPVAAYSAQDLYEPCHEGDADSRWGAAAEAECEQYILGFTDAYLLLTDGGKADNICLPEQNRLDEVRWAFMRWYHQHFDDRAQPAGEGLHKVLKAGFACK